MNDTMMYPQFGDIYFAELIGDENIQAGKRPVIIAQNNIGNMHSRTVEVIPMSSRIGKAKYMPTHVIVRPSQRNGLQAMSVALAEQVVTINKKRLLRFLGKLDAVELRMIGEARKVQSPFFG